MKLVNNICKNWHVVLHGFMSWTISLLGAMTSWSEVVRQPTETPGGHCTQPGDSLAHDLLKNHSMLFYMLALIKFIGFFDDIMFCLVSLRGAARQIFLPWDRAWFAVSPCPQPLS